MSNRTCTVPGCPEPHHGNGFCGKHNARWRRTGDPQGVRRVPTAECAIEGCTSPHLGLGLCRRHYKISERHGSPEPAHACRACGGPFEPAGREDGVRGGSYVYCPPCAANAPAAYAARGRQLRLERLRANNAGMTDTDRQEAAQYRALILGDPCVYCGAASATVDHIAPVAAGGGDWWHNLAPACQECNAVKRDRPLLTAVLAIGERRAVTVTA